MVTKSIGPDPLARELAAANQPQSEDTSVSSVLASLSASQLAVPKQRPGRPAPDNSLTQVAAVEPQQVPEQEPAQTSQERQLDAQSILASIRRPPAEVPASIQTASVSTGEVDQLNARIRSSLTRQRSLSAAAKAAEQQANIQLASALAAVPVTTPASRVLNEPVASESPTESKTPILDSVALANSQQAKDLVRKTMAALSASRSTTPTFRNPSVANTAAVTVPNTRPATEEEAITASVEVQTAQAGSELELGDLEGNLVKLWAVAETTRIGPLAQLTAPRYIQGTRRLTPSEVYSSGFGEKSGRLRADRFTGRALQRVAFANLKSFN